MQACESLVHGEQLWMNVNPFAQTTVYEHHDGHGFGHELREHKNVQKTLDISNVPILNSIVEHHW